MVTSYERYVEQIIGGLCASSKPVITRTVDERGVLLTVSGISREDMGLVIGRNGEHMRAIRTLVRVVGKRENARVSVKLLEPADSLEKKVVERST